MFGKKLVEHNPENQNNVFLLARASIQTSNLAQWLNGANAETPALIENSIEHNLRLLEQHPFNLKTKLELAWLHGELGEYYFSTDDQTNAKVHFESNLERLNELFVLAPEEPSHTRELVWMLSVCPNRELRDPEMALELALKHATTPEATSNVHEYLACAYFANNQFENCAESFSELEQVGEPSQGICFVAALAELKAGNLNRAKEILAKEESDWKNQRGTLLIRRLRNLIEDQLAAAD